MKMRRQRSRQRFDRNDRYGTLEEGRRQAKRRLSLSRFSGREMPSRKDREGRKELVQVYCM